MQSHTIDDLEIGQAAEFSKTVTETDVSFFSAISGDFNPLHVDVEYAAKSRFGARVAHGPLTLALSAGLLGMQLPGLGTIAVTNHIEYLKPVYIGDTITSRVEVVDLDRDANRATMGLGWRNQSGELVAEGYAVVKPPRVRDPAAPPASASASVAVTGRGPGTARGA
jgi:3-hydroxybutyryl-CoA dehydratase